MPIRRIYLTIAVAALITACGGTTSAPGAAIVTASRPAATIGTSGSPGGAGGSSIRSDACTLPRADVEAVIGALTGQPLSTTNAVPGTSGINVTACVYTSNDGALTAAVAKAPVSKADFETAARQVPGVQSEPGVGDQAFSGSVTAGTLGNATVLFVLKGTTYFTLQASSRSKDGGALRSALRSLASAIASGL